jgi:propionyl-CoA carboxylase alpha chain
VIAKLLVANRGEIARRVLRAARGMGIATVAVFSDADRDALFVAEADEAVPLGGVTPAESYLRVDAVLEAAERTGADAVHPGYGFLAENPELAAGCCKHGITFVGPPPEVLAVLGDKVEAKRVMAAAGVPVLPGAEVTGLDGDELAAAAERVGLPVIVKATFGGGGIGMRVVREPVELRAAVDAARRQAGAAFGDDAVFLERFLKAPRHVEVQVLADAHGRVVHLFERECSVQRRHQKLVEEAPSWAVDADLRRRLGDAAVAAAQAVGYVGAGTVEFLLPGSSSSWRSTPASRSSTRSPRPSPGWTWCGCSSWSPPASPCPTRRSARPCAATPSRPGCTPRTPAAASCRRRAPCTASRWPTPGCGWTPAWATARWSACTTTRCSPR